jgi:hypothetical protein
VDIEIPDGHAIHAEPSVEFHGHLAAMKWLFSADTSLHATIQNGVLAAHHRKSFPVKVPATLRAAIFRSLPGGMRGERVCAVQ